MKSWIRGFYLWLIGGLAWDSPRFPCSQGLFDRNELLKNPHSYPLVKLLEYGQPLYFYSLYMDVLGSASYVRQKEEELNLLRKEIGPLAKHVGFLEEALSGMSHINHNPDDDLQFIDFPPKPAIDRREIALTVGLSLMLFLGISIVFGIDIQGITIDQIPMIILALAGAICINVAEFLGVYRLVKVFRRYEPQRNHSDDNRYANQVPFWIRIRSGDAVIWVSLLIVLLETLFAFLGLLSLLPPSIQGEFVYQLAAFAAAGLTATVNLVIAWGNAISEVQWEQTIEELKLKQRSELQELREDQDYLDKRDKYLKKEEELGKIKQEIKQKLGAVRNELSVKKAEIARREKELEKINEDAIFEYERWVIAVRRWMRENPDKIERFTKELYPKWRDEDKY